VLYDSGNQEHNKDRNTIYVVLLQNMALPYLGAEAIKDQDGTY
jgi:hypothetical protein